MPPLSQVPLCPAREEIEHRSFTVDPPLGQGSEALGLSGSPSPNLSHPTPTHFLSLLFKLAGHHSVQGQENKRGGREPVKENTNTIRPQTSLAERSSLGERMWLPGPRMFVLGPCLGWTSAFTCRLVLGLLLTPQRCCGSPQARLIEERPGLHG